MKETQLILNLKQKLSLMKRLKRELKMRQQNILNMGKRYKPLPKERKIV
jgi:hypothetical protein